MNRAHGTTTEPGARQVRSCPHCGEECDRDSVDVGVGIIHGPYGCRCGWSEYEEYDIRTRPAGPDALGGYIDQYGGYHPSPVSSEGERS